MEVFWWVVVAVVAANIALGAWLLSRFLREERSRTDVRQPRPPRPPSPRQVQTESDLRRIIAASPDTETAVRNARIVFPEWTAEQARAKVLAHTPPARHHRANGGTA